jgi:hypothetical protein
MMLFHTTLKTSANAKAFWRIVGASMEDKTMGFPEFFHQDKPEHTTGTPKEVPVPLTINSVSNASAASSGQCVPSGGAAISQAKDQPKKSKDGEPLLMDLAKRLRTAPASHDIIGPVLHRSVPIPLAKDLPLRTQPAQPVASVHVASVTVHHVWIQADGATTIPSILSDLCMLVLRSWQPMRQIVWAFAPVAVGITGVSDQCDMLAI